MVKERMSRRRFIAFSATMVGTIKMSNLSYAQEVPDEETRADTSDRSGIRPPESSCTGSWVGTCTYYSNSGCVGCGVNQIMANGEPFREWEMTIAFMQLPLNTVVRVTNLDNGKSVIAKVTDRGGFWRYGILADLSLGVSNAIENESRASNIKINTLDCDE